MTVFALPPGRPFIPSLVEGIWQESRESGRCLSSYWLLLPSQRACQELRTTLEEKAQDRAFLLPHILSLGALPEAVELLPWVVQGGGLPQVMSETECYVLLMAFLQEKSAHLSQPVSISRLAKDFLSLYEQGIMEEVTWENARSLVPDMFAQHWQEVMRLLTVVLEDFPKAVASQGKMDPFSYRRWFVDRLAEGWRCQPPSGPVILAGSTGTIPFVARLQKVIAELPDGKVILPLWEKAAASRLDPLPLTHPQRVIAELLGKMNVSSERVQEWSACPLKAREERARTFLKIFDPLPEPLSLEAKASLRGVTYGQCSHEREEAQLAALLLREILEHPGKTGAVITTSRALAGFIKAELKQWGIVPADSAGTPFSQSLLCQLMALTLDFFVTPRNEALFLEVAKHGLVFRGQHREAWLSLVEEFEEAVLRALSLPKGTASEPNFMRHFKSVGRLGEVWQWCFAPWQGMEPRRRYPLHQWLTQHCEVVGRLMIASDEVACHSSLEPYPLWHSFMHTLAQYKGESKLSPLSLEEYRELLQVIMQGGPNTFEDPTHPNLTLLGPLEQRLLHFDRIIIAGLNQGMWPEQDPPSPWLNERMRQTLGFYPKERRSGQSAHYFCNALASDEVFFTRSLKMEGTLTAPSPWLTRLEAVLGGTLASMEQEIKPWQEWRKALDGRSYDKDKSTLAIPCPPLEARPRRFSATRLELLQKNPYEFYCKEILKLQPAQPLSMHVTPARMGEIIHSILEVFLREVKPTQYSLQQLLLLGEDKLKRTGDPARMFFFSPRFTLIAQEIIALLEENAAHIAEHHVEQSGEYALELNGKSFLLTAKADRLDLFQDGSVAIIDYKTGQAPTLKQVKEMENLQLLVEGMIVEKGGFASLGQRRARAIDYWQLKGGLESIRRTLCHGEILEKLLAQIEDKVRALLTLYDNENQGYPYIAQDRQGYDPYAHLARFYKNGGA